MFRLKAGPIRKAMTPNSSAETYSSQLSAASTLALKTVGPQGYRLGLAGQVIALHFAGGELLEVILPALRHLLIIENDMRVDLTVILWDSASTGVALPEFPWHPPTNEAWKVDTECHLAFYQPQRASLVWFNRRENCAFFWIPDRASTLEESFNPLIYLWSWWFAPQSTQLAHAAAIAGKNGAALLVGPSGSGKSTTALLALNSSLCYLADDYCLITLQPKPTVYSLFATAKVLLPDKARHPWLAPAYRHENSEKALYVVYPQFENNFVLEMPLRAVIAPRITGETSTQLVPTTSMDVLRSLAPSTLMQLSIGTDPARALRLITEIVRWVPCYRLLLGTDFEQIPVVLANLLDG
ncbi:conserved hypothetical protein [Gammaproteobacteria bacterium]